MARQQRYDSGLKKCGGQSGDGHGSLVRILLRMLRRQLLWLRASPRAVIGGLTSVVTAAMMLVRLCCCSCGVV